MRPAALKSFVSTLAPILAIQLIRSFRLPKINTAIMDPGKEQRLLFVHSTGPTHVHQRDKITKTSIRRHIMHDIGKSRRKAKRNPQFNISMSPLVDDDQLALQPFARPFWHQDPLTLLEQQWEMDSFSAYGIALLLSEGKSLLTLGNDSAAASFWFPFAFTSSAFLHHFKSIFSSAPVLKEIYHQSAARAEFMALNRSIGTMSCIEATIAKLGPHLAVGDNVIRAVLAIICYNLLSQDYNQARIHMEGMKAIVTARGGARSLQSNSELELMIFWVDITASLLFNTRPQYPVPMYSMPIVSPAGSTCARSSALTNIFETLETHGGKRQAHVFSCLADLNRVAACFETELSMRGNTLWMDEMFIGLRLNPIAHHLLNWPQQETKISSQMDQVCELLRLGAILWIIWVKRKSRSYPGSPMGYVSDLLHLLSARCSHLRGAPSKASDEFLSMRLWLIFLCWLTSPPESSERTITVKLLADSLQRQGIKERHDIVACVRQMPWISAFETPYEEILDQVQLLHVT